MLRLFCIYFDRRPIWQSDCVVPIQAGRKRTGEVLDMLGDDTGDEISDENLRYGEMTAWYWVWKNYLPQHPELTHVGFCHYRRFLDFAGLSARGKVRMTYAKFCRVFRRFYNEAELGRLAAGYDLLMRRPSTCEDGTPRREFVNSHPLNAADWDLFEAIVRERAPEAAAVIDGALSAPLQSQELQFVMRREVFCDFMDWAFATCRECERRAAWHGECTGNRARIPAFLVERFFMVWLALRKQDPSFKVRELAMVKLTQRPWWYRLLKPFLALTPKATQDRIRNSFK